MSEAISSSMSLGRILSSFSIIYLFLVSFLSSASSQGKSNYQNFFNVRLYPSLDPPKNSISFVASCILISMYSLSSMKLQISSGEIRPFSVRLILAKISAGTKSSFLQRCWRAASRSHSPKPIIWRRLHMRVYVSCKSILYFYLRLNIKN